ncbi:conjugal transfer protein TraI [Mucilaginibacter ginsenosidivorans]|uniref:Conjugal transfer protein TraI n=1 Tax=Mucilaginibacter ginsenosidivorans TaxID=398053 RepID=A0A5B8UU73_9SPHI|nr:conjugal transfer protein TraI [Mucilaginibacter ginsenosidivorans]QEC62449.1 conjugal transfer protein TraI [Mucilaginibacter ginsenosidivorans]
MRFFKVVLPLSMAVILITLPDKKADAQFVIGQVLNQTVGRIIRAIDLGVQKAQNKTIWLQNAQKVIENQLNQLKLSQIAGVSQQQTDLFTKYYHELYTVKEIITNYEQVRNITLEQEALVREYQSGWSLTRQDKHFSAEELKYIASVYTGILKASVNNLDQLLVLVNSFKTQMSDGRRMELINATSRRVDENYNDLKEFNNQNIILSLERAHDEDDIQSTKNLYGIN